MNEAVDDVKVKAVNEMMERIKHGVVLRPVKSQDTKVSFWTKIQSLIDSHESELATSHRILNWNDRKRNFLYRNSKKFNTITQQSDLIYPKPTKLVN